MERYEAKRAVIIGGTSGIGLATVKMLKRIAAYGILNYYVSVK
ncbi:hypothetical protein [Paenibacillus periandrae]|nr:hypothetical protein [Paenibacillus periandrae]